MSVQTATVPGRSCGQCTLCCRLPEIEEFSKPANDWCGHCAPDRGCRIYDSRPRLCRDFFCRYMTDASMSEIWAPTISHMMVYNQGPQITVLVDPDHEAIWANAPYLQEIEGWALQAEPSGGYVIVYFGDHVTKIEPGRSV